MSEDTQVASKPDLTALPREVRVRIAVAKTQGWRYVRTRGRPIGVPPEPALTYRRNLNLGDLEVLPDYLIDPAAWGALFMKELNGLENRQDGSCCGWWFNDNRSGPRISYGLTCGSLGEAVCAAVLAKHGIDWSTLEAIQ